MCDSDEDEFLSASEGEFDEDDVSKDVKKEEKPASVEKVLEPVKEPEPVEEPEEEDEEEEPAADSGLVSEEASRAEPLPEIAPADPETSSSKESLLDEPAFSLSSGSGSQAASLSSEKQRLLEEVVKETLTLDDEPEEPEPEPVKKASQDSSSGTEKSNDDGGWDDFGTEPSEPEQIPAVPECMEVEEEAAKTKKPVDKPVTKEKKVPEIKKKVPVSAPKNEEEDAGWDDWDAEPASTDAVAAAEVPKKESFDGWDDWSVVDQKKVVEEKKNEGTDSWFREQMEQKKPSTEKKTTSGGWGWGGLVSAVGETLSSTIETSLGLPSAEEVARRQRQHQKELAEKGEIDEEPEPSPSDPSPSMSQPLASGFGMLSGLVSGGMDVLETIGKKTFEAVTVKDEKAGKRRMIFTEDSGQNLSDVLRELRERQDRELPFQMGSAAVNKQTPDVASLFGRSEGMAHLEALEMLSTNRPKATPKFEREYNTALSYIDTERVEDGEFTDLLQAILKRINLPYEPTTLTNCDTEIDNRLAWCDGKEADELFADAMTALVDFTAASVQVVSKLANLLLIIRQDINYKDFIALCSLLSQRLNYISSRYVDALSICEDQTKADDLVTQLHVECSVAVDFLKQAHRLLVPMFHSL